MLNNTRLRKLHPTITYFLLVIVLKNPATIFKSLPEVSVRRGRERFAIAIEIRRVAIDFLHSPWQKSTIHCANMSDLLSKRVPSVVEVIDADTSPAAVFVFEKSTFRSKSAFDFLGTSLHFDLLSVIFGI